MKKEVDSNIFKAQILDDIKAGKPLFGKDGALALMIENIVNAVLEGRHIVTLAKSGKCQSRTGHYLATTCDKILR